MQNVDGDVRDFDALSGAVARHRPEVVIHMAAQALVRPSFVDPRSTYEINVMGTVNVLDAVRVADDVRVVVNVTSDKCYENREWDWGYREDEPKGGHDPYSNSKGCAELVTDSAAARRPGGSCSRTSIVPGEPPRFLHHRQDRRIRMGGRRPATASLEHGRTARRAKRCRSAR